MSQLDSEDNIKLLKEKRADFQRERIITADPDRKFELKKKIEDIDSEIQELEPDEKNLLYEALLSLNYEKQVDKFARFWETDTNPKVGSFLVMGEPKRGQRWLVNRLLHLKSLPDTTTAKKVSISLTYNESYIEDLWKKLSSELRSSASPQELVKRIYKHWQNETVIIVLHNLDLMCSDERNQIVEKLWNPLVNRVQQHSQPCQSYLVMFLVDNKGCTSKWQIDCANDLNKWQLPQPVVMPMLENFHENILTAWMINNSTLPNFPEDNEELQKLATYFWERSLNGNPETMMDEICTHCGSSLSAINKQLAL